MRVLLQVLAMSLMASSAFAQTALPQRMLDAAPLNIQFQNAALQDVLQVVAEAAGVTIRLSPDIDATRPVNVRFTNAKVADVFTFLLAAGDLGFTVDNETTLTLAPKRP